MTTVVVNEQICNTRSNKYIPPKPPDPPSASLQPVHQCLQSTSVTPSSIVTTVTSLPQLNRVSSASIPQFNVTRLLHVPVLVNQWVPATALVDSGASCNFTSSQFVQHHQLPQFEIESITVNLAVDKSTISNHVTTIQLTLPCGFTFHLTAVIVPNLSNDIILGINFLKVFQPDINWNNETITIDRNKLPENTITNVTDHTTPLMLQSYTIESDSSPNTSSIVRQQRRQQHIHNHHSQIHKSVTTNCNTSTSNTTPTSKYENDMYDTYSDVFAPVPPGLPPERPNFSYTIDTLPNATPPAKAPYRLSTIHNDELKKQLDTLLVNKWIRPSRSSYAAPVLFTTKKDNTWRMCIDYRDLNNITIKNKYPLPHINQLIDRLSNAKWFSKLDLANGYHQIRVDPAHVHKTAFTTRYGMFEWLVLPFGLTNAPSIFMQLMQEVLAPFLDTFVVVYLDDILIYSTTLEAHVNHVHQVLQTLRKHQLFAKRSKCLLFQQRIEFLGYIISANGIEMESNKVQQILNWPTPASVKQVRQFLGLAGFYRRFIDNFSSIAAPLSNLTKINTTFTWTPECNKAFNSLKLNISSEPVLMLPREREPFTIQTDASKYAIGGVLMQYDEQNQLRPIAFTSRKLQQAETNYATHDQEMLAVIHSLKQWKHYVLNGTLTTIITDHHSLRFFPTQRHLSPRQTRWMEFIQQFNLNIIYKPGKTNTVADALSRRPDYELTTDTNDTTNEYEIDESMPNTTNKTRINLNNSTTTSINTNTTPNLNQTNLLTTIKNTYVHDHDLQQFLNDRDHRYSTRNGLIIYDNRIVIPNDNNLRTTIISQHHDTITSAHPGATKTIELITRLFYWKHMHTDIKQYVQTCTHCQSNKFSTKSPQGLLHTIDTPDTRWHTITTDFITKLPRTKSGYDAIAVFVDKFSKMAHYVPTNTNINATDFCNLFITNIVRLHGLPATIISDRDSRFTSSFWSAVCKQLTIKLSMSTAYHPMSDGQTERVNRTLEESLRSYVNYNQDNWDQHLPLIEFAHNNVIHTSTNYSPFYLNYGAHPRSPVATALGPECNINDTAANVINNIYDVLDEALSNIEKSQEKQRKYANNHRRDFEQLEIGDLVLLSTTNLKSTGPGRAEKLSPQRIGPFRITRVLSKLNYELDLPEMMNKKYNVFHISLLTKYHPNDTNKFPSRPTTITRPPPEVIDNDEVYEVEQILKHRYNGNKRQYLVHWKGYDIHESTWEPLSSFKFHRDLVNKYEQKVRNQQQ